MPAHRSSPLACFYSATLAWNQTAVDTVTRGEVEGRWPDESTNQDYDIDH
jgi:hypothetical protein